MDSMMYPNGNDRVPGWAHRGPAFGPWHRALLRHFEQDLQSIDSSVTLPYWDWTVNNSSGTEAGSPWTDDLMGARNPEGVDVVTGPFRKGVWHLNILESFDMATNLQRALGASNLQPPTTPFPVLTLPTPANVLGALAEKPYDSPPWNQEASPSFRNRLEGWYGPGSIHNRVHLWVGGTMLPSTSPNDPVFFLHHCNIDRLWAKWQRSTEGVYVPTEGDATAPVGHRLKDFMLPWGSPVTVESTLNHATMGYGYDDNLTQDLHHIITEETLLHMPVWNYHVSHHTQHDITKQAMPMMFDLSAEDKVAGGHSLL